MSKNEPSENIKTILMGIENIRKFIKDAAKKSPDKKLTGYIDHIVYMNNVLDDIIKIFNWFDDASLNREIDLNEIKNELDELKTQVAQGSS
tara:strand:- start:1249 stop:1521 length:273 start_codon:yes stop_codon:yes gene_type:complete